MKNNREMLILKFLTTENKLEVFALAEEAGISQVTMRKDLDELEHRGIIVREHGCASLRSAAESAPERSTSAPDRACKPQHRSGGAVFPASQGY